MPSARMLWVVSLFAVAWASLAATANAVRPPARPEAAAQAPNPAAVLFEGARLISGDGGAAVENAAFLVQNGRFTRVGARGAVDLPPGGRRVDLSGKTVIPGLIDSHNHIGYQDFKALGHGCDEAYSNKTFCGPENYTRDNILEHLRRAAWFGLAAV